MDADGTPTDKASDDIDRASRLARRRGSWKRRAMVTSITTVVVVAGGVGAYAAVANSQKASGAAVTPPTSAPSTPSTTVVISTTTAPKTTTTSIPAIVQPKYQALPSPGSGLSEGDRGPVVLAYEARMKALHFDPGPVDGVFGQDTEYAVIAVQKYYGLPRTGVINSAVDLALTDFHYSPAEPKSEPDRVEIDLDRQVLTVFDNWQPILLTTTSTGSGEYFCGGVDGCQYAITPTGHFHFYDFVKGWQNGKLGAMWNPYYFNGSDAVHGLASVPPYPASHGCSRIPMDIANYFYTLVHQGESVFVVGTPMKAGNGYVGPVKTPPSTSTTVPATTTTLKQAPTTTTPTTVKKATTPTTVKKPPTTTTPTT